MLTSAGAFFKFMTAREALRVAKESGAPWPWSPDAILTAWKFTNVKREHDRTTVWMRKNWTGPNEGRPPGEIIFNCALFRYFGTSEFAEALGWRYDWDPHEVAALAAARMTRGERVFTGAYIIPTLGHRGPKAEAVAHLILSPLWKARDRLAKIAADTRSWRATAEALRVLPGFGGSGFMAKETLQDAIQTPALAAVTDRDKWCPAGPGARRGLNRLANRPLNAAVSEEKLVTEMVALLDLSRAHPVNGLPPLELHDVQFQLCEFDKYERVRKGEGRPRSKYICRL